MEGLHAAGGAEGVLGFVSVEAVGGEAILSTQHLEMIRRDDEVFVLLLDTNTAAVRRDERMEVLG